MSAKAYLPTPVSKEKKEQAPWIEVYDDFYVMELAQGSLVKHDGMMAFIPNATIDHMCPKPPADDKYEE